MDEYLNQQRTNVELQASHHASKHFSNSADSFKHGAKMTWPIREGLVNRVWVIWIIIWYPRFCFFLHVDGRALSVDRVTRNDCWSAHISRPAAFKSEIFSRATYRSNMKHPQNVIARILYSSSLR